MAEAFIRQRLQDWAKALSAKDIRGATSLYAPDIVSFDINPPLRYAGAETKRQAWLKAFAAYPGGFSYELPNPEVTAEGDLAFVHSLNHVRGTLASGHTTEMWVRWTACFRRIDGVWLVVHDHVSVPADLEHGKAGRPSKGPPHSPRIGLTRRGSPPTNGPSGPSCGPGPRGMGHCRARGRGTAWADLRKRNRGIDSGRRCARRCSDRGSSS